MGKGLESRRSLNCVAGGQHLPNDAPPKMLAALKVPALDAMAGAQSDAAAPPDTAAVVFGVCAGAFRASPRSCAAACELSDAGAPGCAALCVAEPVGMMTEESGTIDEVGTLNGSQPAAMEATPADLPDVEQSVPAVPLPTAFACALA